MPLADVPLSHYLLRVLAVAYGLYAVAVFLVFGLLAFVFVLLPIGIVARRQTARVAAQAFLLAAGIRLRSIDQQNLPAGPCVVVANHASYLDGIVLKASLPARFSFVIKKEIRHVPLASLLLRRIGAEFVDRSNRQAAAIDARRLIKAADAGQALVFFPEGTFIAQPGLGKFHTGAFAIAARAALPIVPVVIRGTRAMLPSGRSLPRPGRIQIQVLPAFGPMRNMDAAAASIATRDQARSRLLAALGEPDLSENDTAASRPTQRLKE